LTGRGSPSRNGVRRADGYRVSRPRSAGSTRLELTRLLPSRTLVYPAESSKTLAISDFARTISAPTSPIPSDGER
jgi:hypothetical protein